MSDSIFETRARFHVPDAYRHLEQKERERFFLTEFNARWIEAYKTHGKKRVEHLKTVDKVIAVFSSLLAILFPLAHLYLPAWVPWGIGLPLIFFLWIGRSHLQSYIEKCKVDALSRPFFLEFLQHHDYRSLHPYGPWDLPKSDPRLHSDKIMEKHKVARHSGQWIEEIVGVKSRDDLQKDLYDLEITAHIQEAIALEFANGDQFVQEGQSLRAARTAVNGAFQSNDPLSFSEKIEAFKKEIYGKYYSLSFPRKTGGKWEKPLDLTRFDLNNLTIERLYREIFDLHQKGVALYQVDHPDWSEYHDQVGALQQDITQENWNVLSADEKRRYFYHFYHQTKRIEGKLKEWLAKHSSSQISFFETKLEKYRKEESPPEGATDLLKAWIDHNGRYANTKIVEIPSTVQLPEQLKLWLERHSRTRFLTPNELQKQLEHIEQAIVQAIQKMEEIKEKRDEIELNKNLEEFKHNTFIPLVRRIHQLGSSSIWREFFKDFVISSTESFSRENLTNEEINLNRGLQKIDRKISNLHRGRFLGLRVPTILLLLPIPSILAFYFSNPWIFWGLSLITVLEEGLSYYIDLRLKAMEQKKESVKHLHQLRYSPDIRVISGEHPELAILKEIQQKYGLEGIAPTWARVLAEGEKVLAAPLEKEAKGKGKQVLRRIAQKGRDKAIPFLNNRLLFKSGELLYSRSLTKTKKEALRKNIKSLKGTLKHETTLKTKKQYRPTLSKYEQLIRERQVVDERLDATVEAMRGLHRWLELFEREVEQYNQREECLKRELGEGFEMAAFGEAEINCLMQGMKGERRAFEMNSFLSDLPEQQRLFLAIKHGMVDYLQAIDQKRLRRIARAFYKNQFIVALDFNRGKLIDFSRHIESGIHIAQSKQHVEEQIAQYQEIFSTLITQKKELEEKYAQLSAQLNKKFPTPPLPATSKERLESILFDHSMKTKELLFEDKKLATWHFWCENRESLRKLYSDLNDFDRKAVWWRLPQPFRDELSG